MFSMVEHSRGGLTKPQQAIIDSPAQISLAYKDPRSKVDPKVYLGCTNGVGRRADGAHELVHGTSNGTSSLNANGDIPPRRLANGDSGCSRGVDDESARHKESDPGLLLFSAYSAATIAPQIEAFKAFVTTSKATVTDLAYTLANRRERKPFRSYAVTADKGCFEISASIGAQAPQPRIAWVFTGQGAQWPSMGRELIDTDPVFRATILELDRFLLTLPTPPPWNIERRLNFADLIQNGIHTYKFCRGVTKDWFRESRAPSRVRLPYVNRYTGGACRCPPVLGTRT